MPEENPRLRSDLRLAAAEVGGQRVVLVQDPLGLLPKPVALGGQALELVALLDGRHSIADIQMALMRLQGGVLVTGEEVAKALLPLDQALLLDNGRYRAARAELVRRFAAQPALEASHAGEAYPAGGRELAAWLERVLAAPGEAGRPEGQVCAVVAPHLDPRPAERVYGAAYRPLRGLGFDRVVVLGVGHSLREGLLALTAKDVDTPLGRIATDRELVAGLRRAAGRAAAPDDFAFRGEHSVEFQAVFLKHVLAGGDFRIVPVLCGSPEPAPEADGRAGQAAGLKSFWRALGRAIAAGPGRTLLVAGVDLSHIGPKFGHGADAQALAPESEAHDRALLEALCAPDAEAFRAEVRRAQGRFNVCGYGALTGLLELLPRGARGKLLAYHNWHEPPTRSAVSCAAAVFTLAVK